ncbi:MAG: hypothetical protein Q7S95_03210 [bacterium]|nr:hypothetical protein [bacterium]
MDEQTPTPPQMPSTKQQSWGALISIVVIVLMIVVGAFYAWGKRIAQNQQYPSAATSTSL